jgi:hypothetical protein
MPLSKGDLTSTERRIFEQQINRRVDPLVLLDVFQALRKRNIPPGIFNFDNIDPSLSHKEQMAQAKEELKRYGLTEEDIEKIGIEAEEDIEAEEERIKDEKEKYILSEFEKQAGLKPGIAEAFADVLARRIIKKIKEEIEEPIEVPRIEKAKSRLEVPIGRPAFLMFRALKKSSKKIAHDMYKEERERLNKLNDEMNAGLRSIVLDYAKSGIIFDPTPRERKGEVKAFDSFVNLRLRPEKEFVELREY